MDRSSVVTLISETWIEDAYGIYQPTRTERDVYCNVSSVTQSDWYEGGRNGLNPEYRFTMFFYDYADEEIIRYNGKEYTVYRTYRAENDEIELYCQRKQGNVTSN